MTHPILHFEIVGKDQQLLENFYRDVFDWKIESVMPGYSLVDTGSGIGGGIGTSGNGASHVTFYVGVADIQAAMATVERKGGTIAFGPQAIPDGGRIACFHDPEGHLIGLVQGPPGK